jgi:hypothetical protein
VITRHGTPVIELRPVQPLATPMTDADLAWLANHRLQPKQAPSEPAGDLISSMRDEDAH